MKKGNKLHKNKKGINESQLSRENKRNAVRIKRDNAATKKSKKLPKSSSLISVKIEV
jgi:hypothetical protein